jgi:hypothetical protein
VNAADATAFTIKLLGTADGFNLRGEFYDAGTGEHLIIASSDGHLSVPVEDLPAFRQLIQAAEAHAVQQGWLTTNGGGR